jgi:hypothetical protein
MKTCERARIKQRVGGPGGGRGGRGSLTIPPFYIPLSLTHTHTPSLSLSLSLSLPPSLSLYTRACTHTTTKHFSTPTPSSTHLPPLMLQLLGLSHSASASLYLNPTPLHPILSLIATPRNRRSIASPLGLGGQANPHLVGLVDDADEREDVDGRLLRRGVRLLRRRRALQPGMSGSESAVSLWVQSSGV